MTFLEKNCDVGKNYLDVKYKFFVEERETTKKGLKRKEYRKSIETFPVFLNYLM